MKILKTFFFNNFEYGALKVTKKTSKLECQFFLSLAVFQFSYRNIKICPPCTTFKFGDYCSLEVPGLNILFHSGREKHFELHIVLGHSVAVKITEFFSLNMKNGKFTFQLLLFISSMNT